MPYPGFSSETLAAGLLGQTVGFRDWDGSEGDNGRGRGEWHFIIHTFSFCLYNFTLVYFSPAAAALAVSGSGDTVDLTNK